MSDAELHMVIRRELELMESRCRWSRDALEARLDDEFEEIGASGRHWTRAVLIADLLSSPPPHVHVTDVVARHVDDHVVLVTYVTTSNDRCVRRSSWWRDTGGTWKCFFHQGTLIPGEPLAG